MKLSARVPVSAGPVSAVPVAAVLMALLLVSATGCKRLYANAEINKGVSEFKNARYEQAEGHLQKAIADDPDYPIPRLMLATVYASQVVSGSTDPANIKNAQMATEGFQYVLNKNPNDLSALKGLASVDRNMGKIVDAKNLEEKVISLSPSGSDAADAYDIIGGVDWNEAYQNANKALKAENLDDKSDGNIKLSKPACQKLVAVNTPLITEGITDLNKAVEINPNFEDAMTYLSLLHRRKADLECGNLPAIKTDLDAADQWVARSMNARKVNEKKKEDALKGGVAQ